MESGARGATLIQTAALLGYLSARELLVQTFHNPTQYARLFLLPM